MRAALPYLADGLLTGLLLAAGLLAVGTLRGLSLADCGGWLFLAGLGLALLSAPVAIHTGRSPAGLLGSLRPPPDRGPEPALARLWMDRLVSPRNVWLIAGLTLVGLSFLPPFLARGG